jgi:hypothetical protein
MPPLLGFDGRPYVAMLLYGEPTLGKSTMAATAPKPMKVFCFDQKQKEMPYLKRGKIMEEGDVGYGKEGKIRVPFIKVAHRQTGEHIVTIEYFRNVDPENPYAYPAFLAAMTEMHKDFDYYETFVLDSVTFLEKAARYYDQFVTNAGAKHKGQHYIVSAEAVEMQVMGRFASLPKNSIVIAHVHEKRNKEGEDESKQRFGSLKLYVPGAPGKKAKELPSAFSEIYRTFVEGKEYKLQTKTDGLWLAATQIDAPNPCAPTWSSLWANWKGFD